jgi:2-polyprenyl-3-methyl-5-hydroxy-6-metoxy-1,4-benzoquinol methylase
MKLRYVLTILRMMKIPGLYLIMQDWRAFVRMHFIFTAYESGLLKDLAKPCDRETLLETLHVKRPELLDALLEIGLATKELAMQNGQFFIKGKRSKAVMGAEGDMLAALVQAHITYYNDTYRNAADRMYGADLSEDLDKIGNLIARASEMLQPVIKDFISTIVRGKRPIRVLDVGCGSGILLRGIYDVNPHATGVGLDIDEAVVRHAKHNIYSWGLGDRFEIRQGDIRRLTHEIVGPFDFITLINILYYFNREDRLTLMNDLRTMLSPKGRVAVTMTFHSRGKDISAANLNIVTSSLKGVTPLPKLEEITSLLKQSGFDKIKVHRFIPGSTYYGIVAQNSKM